MHMAATPASCVTCIMCHLHACVTCIMCHMHACTFSCTPARQLRLCHTWSAHALNKHMPTKLPSYSSKGAPPCVPPPPPCVLPPPPSVHPCTHRWTSHANTVQHAHMRTCTSPPTLTSQPLRLLNCSTSSDIGRYTPVPLLASSTPSLQNKQYK